MKPWQQLLTQRMAHDAAPWANAYAVSYNGTTQASYCAAPADIQGLSSWSVSLWVKASWTANSALWAIGRFQDAHWTHVMPVISSDGAQWRMCFFRDDTFPVNENFTYAGLAPANLMNVWHNHLISYDAGTTTLGWAINGTTVKTWVGAYPLSSLFAGRTYPAERLSLSAYPLNNTFNQFQYGAKDELTIWSAAKTYADVSAAGAPKDLRGSAGLLHYWRCGDTAGDTGDAVQDAVAGGPSLTGVNSPTLVAV